MPDFALTPQCCPEWGRLDYDEVVGAATGSSRPTEDESLICGLCGVDLKDHDSTEAGGNA